MHDQVCQRGSEGVKESEGAGDKTVDQGEATRSRQRQTVSSQDALKMAQEPREVKVPESNFLLKLPRTVTGSHV